MIWPRRVEIGLVSWEHRNWGKKYKWIMHTGNIEAGWRGMDNSGTMEWEGMSWFKCPWKLLKQASVQKRTHTYREKNKACICFLIFLVPSHESQWLEKEGRQTPIGHFNSAVMCPMDNSPEVGWWDYALASLCHSCAWALTPLSHAGVALAQKCLSLKLFRDHSGLEGHFAAIAIQWW